MCPCARFRLQWFDQFLKGKDTPLLSQAPVRVFVMGVNRWREAREWPPRAHPQRFYLESRGRANTLAGDGQLAPAHSRPMRLRGAATTGSCSIRKIRCPPRAARLCCNPKVFPWGPKDQRAVEQRRDVLVYTTAPLPRDVEVDRSGARGIVRGHLRARYGLHRQAGGRVAGRARAKPDGRHPAAALPPIAGEAGAGAAGRNLQADDRRRGDRQCVSEGASHPDRNIQQQLSALRPESEYRRARSRMPPNCARLRRRFITTRGGRPTCCCRCCKIDPD
jgi:hypothetical protein